MSEKLVPQLRFNEFDDEWNIVKLSQISKPIKDKNKDKKIDTVFSNSAKKGIILQENFFEKDIANKTNTGGYYIVKPGDFVYNPRISNNAPVGPIKQNETGLTGIVSPLYSIFRISSKINDKYMKYYFASTKWHNYIRSVANYGARHDRINITQKDLYNLPISLPSISEQIKIANFLTLINKKIYLMEEKYAKYLSFKKYLMQQIFAQNLRFEFEGEWETRFIEEIFDITRGEVIAKTLIKETPNKEYCYPVFSSQTKNKGIMGYYNDFDFDGEFITWTTDGANAGKTVYRKGKFKCTNVCGVLKAKTKYNGFANQFIADYLDSITHRYVSYVGNPKLMNNVMAKIKIKYPPLEEQKKISELFNKVDYSIDLIENQIESLQVFKKGLLQQIFV